MKDFRILFSIVFSAVLIVGAISSANAQADAGSIIASLQYPVQGLGGCANAGECKTFCDSPSNMETCLNFAEKNGMLDRKDIDLGRKVAKRVAEGKTPGQCKTKAECESFCAGKVENIVECVAFAEELGVIPAEELAQAKQVIKALQSGAKMPGQCKEKSECENYCKDDGHFEECIGFAEAAGFVSKEEAEMARKVGGKGPGGCKSKEACEKYCNASERADECFDFALNKGLIPEGQLKEMKAGVEKMKQGLNMVPEEVRSDVANCIQNALGEPAYRRMMDSDVITDRNAAGKIQGCFTEGVKGIAEKMKEKYMGGSEAPSIDNIPPEARGDVERIQNEMMNRKAPPTQEEIDNIKDQMMEKYLQQRIPQPQGIPEGIPQGYGPQ